MFSGNICDTLNDEKFYLASPTELFFKEEKVSASRLTIGTKDQQNEVHFTKTRLLQMSAIHLKRKMLSHKQSVHKLLNDEYRSSKMVILTRFTKCKATIYERLSLLSLLTTERVRNEQELRFAIVDPLMELICVTWDLKVYT